jgi:hypothetical protein
MMRKILSLILVTLSLAATSLTYIASAQAGATDKNDCNGMARHLHEC